MTRVQLAIAVCAGLAGRPAGAATADVEQIVRRSVENNDRNWKAAPQYEFTEQDVIVKGGQRTSRTYQVLMMEGSPYRKTMAVNGRPLSEAELKRQDEKARRELERRRRETPAARKQRIAGYQRERNQNHALMREMIKAFTFKLAGSETVNGRHCFRVEASPRPGYTPQRRETKVLTGMRGTLWIDSAECQWVRVRAVVFRPVAFGLFVAHVQPGTEFTLDEAPAGAGIWLPTHFRTRVNASVLFWQRNSTDDETYSNYHRTGTASKLNAESSAHGGAGNVGTGLLN